MAALGTKENGQFQNVPVVCQRSKYINTLRDENKAEGPLPSPRLKSPYGWVSTNDHTPGRSFYSILPPPLCYKNIHYVLLRFLHIALTNISAHAHSIFEISVSLVIKSSLPILFI